MDSFYKMSVFYNISLDNSIRNIKLSCFPAFDHAQSVCAGNNHGIL